MWQRLVGIHAITRLHDAILGAIELWSIEQYAFLIKLFLSKVALLRVSSVRALM